MVRTMLSTVRALLNLKSVLKVLWASSVVTVVSVSTRVTCTGTPFFTTPFEIWAGKKPDLASVCVFGSLCWYHVRTKQSLKPGDRGSLAMLNCHATKQKAYKLWDVVNKKVVVS